MTSSFPTNFDNDATLPLISGNITQIGGSAINALRDAIFAIEENIGLLAQGSTSSIAARLNQSLDSSGNILPSAIASMGLITLPIVNSMVSATAGIQESKLALTYGTTYLNNFITVVNEGVQTSLSFIENHGFKLEPHINGSDYNHYMRDILVALSSTNYFTNASGALRNNTNLYTLFNDINDDLILHEVANNQPVSIINGIQAGGTLPPTNYGHVGAGIWLNSSNFSFIPQTITDLQSFANFVDSSNVLILGTRIQTLYANGIPVNARAGALPDQTLGQLLVPPTNATTYLLYGGTNAPFDDIDHGDDLVEFFPAPSLESNNSFDASFALVKPGDILTINFDGYGNFSVQYIIREIKYSVSGGNKRYVVRINGKNLLAATGVIASINSPLFNNNKSGVLALGQAQLNSPYGISGAYPSLIAGCPRGAEVLSVGFDPNLINSTHYLLYIAVYPTGNPLDQVVNLPPIDISGNEGITPGAYDLDSVVFAVNNQFRTPGFNNRFMAFQRDGEFGIKMTDSINNISFSIIDGAVNSSTGLYNQSLSVSTYPNNAIGVPGFDLVDASGFGPSGSGVSSPAFSSTYPTPLSALLPTKIWCPLTRKTYYVNGVERDNFAPEPFQLLDGYGDGYWPATIINRTVIPGVRVEVVYQVPSDLASSGITIGKTITAIAQSGGSFVDDGRFFISDIQFNNCSSCGDPTAITTTNITVYDAIQSPTGNTPHVSAPIGTSVFLYFSSDSISFNIENMSDWSATGPFKRSMEVYVNQDGYTFTQERGRMNISGSNLSLSTPAGTVPLFGNSNLNAFNIVSISPKLRGYAFGTIDKINLTITSYNQATGSYVGFLCKWDGSTASNLGPIISSKKGVITRFYDQSRVEYIDFALDIDDTSTPTISSIQRIDIQLFPTLQLDEEVMLLGTVQVNDSLKTLDWLQDGRQFGNVSEEQFTTSALNYIAEPTQLINENGVIRGLGVLSASVGSGTVSLNGGVAVVNGSIIEIGPEVINIPTVVEALYPSFTTTINTITWYLCVNDSGELELIASTDFDPLGSTAATYAAAGLDHTRFFYVSNPTASITYPVEGTYFSNLIFNVRNVCPIAIITATVSGSPASITSISSTDARRFISGYSGLSAPFVLGSSASFRSFEALNAWLNQLINSNSGLNAGDNNVGATVIVKGSVNINSTVSLGYYSPVSFIGDGGIFNVNTSTGFDIGNNVSFDNITFNYNYDPFVSSDTGYHPLDLVNGQNGLIYCSVGINQNVSITNCIFNWVPDNTSTVVNRYPFISYQFSTAGQVMEGIDITGNTFRSQLANQPDIRAAIAFVSTIIVAPAAIAGVQLINANISNNVCMQEQMILVSNFLDGSSSLNCAITPINTTIAQNQCGTIGFITRFMDPNDFPYFVVSPGGINPNILISNNTCKLIDSLDGYGHEVKATISIDSGFVSSASIIENNTTSWIRSVMHASAGSNSIDGNSTAIIRSNNIKAHNTNYRQNYNTTYSSANSDNSGISVLNPVKDGYCKVIIDNNMISNGIYTNSDTSTTNYTYDFGILSGHISTITNNNINGFGNTLLSLPVGPVGIALPNPGSIVKNNIIYRKGVAMASYIDAGNTFIPKSQHIITDNVFDTTTVDGSNVQVVADISPQSVVCSNINQIGFSVISLTDRQDFFTFLGQTNGTAPGSGAYPNPFLFSDATTSFSIWRTPDSLPANTPLSATSGYLLVGEVGGTGHQERNMSITIPVDTCLPPGAKILTATLGVFITTAGAGSVLDIGGAGQPNNRLTLTLTIYDIMRSTTTAVANSIVDVKNRTVDSASAGAMPTRLDPVPDIFSLSSSLIVGSGGNANVTENQLTSNTQYCQINVPINSQTGTLTTAGNYRIGASIDLNYKKLDNSYSVSWYISPLLITYQW